MGWSFPWASSSGGDFNYDFQAAVTKEQWESGTVEYNFRRADFRPPAGQDSSGLDEFASSIVGTNWETFRREGPGVSAFTLEDGVVHHTYSASSAARSGSGSSDRRRPAPLAARFPYWRRRRFPGASQSAVTARHGPRPGLLSAAAARPGCETPEVIPRLKGGYSVAHIEGILRQYTGA
jgi:hypothetical protein